MVLVLTPSPNKLRYPKMLSIRYGYVRCIAPSEFMYMLIPRKSSRVPSSVVSNLDLRVNFKISSISIGSGLAVWSHMCIVHT